jgi:quercetin dioxygenase-like cupin family protein
MRCIYATPGEPLKVIWIRWAPDGDQRYLAAGYYLTGANQHIQPQEAMLPQDYQFWGERLGTEPVAQPTSPSVPAEHGSNYASQMQALDVARKKLGEKRNPYPATLTFAHESDSKWLSKGMEANFFWAKDITSLGALLDRWIEVMSYKALFQATRPDGGWDFNISQMVWGPHARYVEHSHSIPEFYYMLSGPVEHWIGEQKYRAMPGDIFMTNSYVTHQSRGIVDDLPFRNIGASWAPNGDREVFKRPFYLVEPLPAQPEEAVLGDVTSFH